MEIPAGWSEIPAQSQLLAGEAQKNIVETQLARANAPTDIAAARSKLGEQQATTQLKQQDVQRGQIQTNDAIMANAIATFDPNQPEPDKAWDSLMDSVAAKGITTAEPLKGRYSERMLPIWAAACRAPNPPRARSRRAPGQSQIGAAKGGPAGSEIGASGQDTIEPGSFAATAAQMTPEQAQASLAKLDDARAALQRVKNSPNPDAQWAVEATRLGVPQYAGLRGPDRQAAEDKLEAEIVPHDDILRARLARENQGLPPQVIPATLEKGAMGEIYSINQANPAQPTASVIAQPVPKIGVVGGAYPATGPGGGVLTINPVTGTVQEAGPAATITPRGSAANTMDRYGLWISAHPGDEAGALALCHADSR